MKKIIRFFLPFLFMSYTCFCQKSKQEYLEKSRTQKILGWVMLGGGVLAIAGVSKGASGFESTATVGILGGVLVVGSIPLFIASGRNKRKAMNATAYLNIEKIESKNNSYNNSTFIPVLSVKLSF